MVDGWKRVWVCADLDLGMVVYLRRSQPRLTVLDNLGLGLGFCPADLGLGWWSSGIKPDLDRNV